MKPPFAVLWFGGAFDRLGPGCRDVPRKPPQAWNAFRISGDYFAGTAGNELICLERHRGKELWSVRPERGGISFALGGNKALCIDYWQPARRRRGEPASEQATLSAIDLASGKVLWRAEVSIPAAGKKDSPFGLYQPLTPLLSYCEQSDLLVLTANWSSLGAWRGRDGRQLWSKPIPCADPPSRYSMPRPPILLPDVLITHGGQVYDAVTGKLLPERLWRGINVSTRGCNRALACPHVVLLRDADICYFDLDAGGRQTRLRGIRSGCTNALLPAGGLFNAPNLAYHCSCNWPIFTSMALVHMPEAAQWAPGGDRGQ